MNLEKAAGFKSGQNKSWYIKKTQKTFQQTVPRFRGSCFKQNKISDQECFDYLERLLDINFHIWYVIEYPKSDKTIVPPTSGYQYQRYLHCLCNLRKLCRILLCKTDEIRYQSLNNTNAPAWLIERLRQKTNWFYLYQNRQEFYYKTYLVPTPRAYPIHEDEDFMKVYIKIMKTHNVPNDISRLILGRL